MVTIAGTQEMSTTRADDRWHAVMERDRIVLGGGSRSWKVIAPASILLTLPTAEVVEGLANPAPPRDEGSPPT